MYPSTYNFKDEADGTTDTGIEFVTAVTSDDSTYSATIVAIEDGHRKCIKFLSAGDNGAVSYWIANYDDYEGGGIVNIELWIKYIDHGAGIFSYRMQETGNVFARVDISSGTNTINIYYGDGLGGSTTENVALASDTWCHVRWEIDIDNDIQSVWIDGIEKVTDENLVADRTISKISATLIYLYNGGGANSLEGYIDAVGHDWDTSYNVGDNIHWRHYKESIDDFEGDDVGTVDTSITWVDSVSNAGNVEITQEFNEHKKVLRQRSEGEAVGYSIHNFASQSKNGWFSTWIKVDDVTNNSGITLYEDATIIVDFKINGSLFQIYTGGAWRQATGSPVPVNSTWYFIYIQWYDAATDNFDLWINNVQYEDGTNCVNNQTSGINKVRIQQSTLLVKTFYIDAPMSSLDSDSRGDNRTFDYLAYTYNDISTDIIGSCQVNRQRAIFQAKSTLTLNELHILQLYNVNSALWFEGNYHDLKKGDPYYTYYFESLNYQALTRQASYTASAEDPDSIMHGCFTNIGQADGRLIYYTEHDPTGSLSPTILNVPLLEIAQRCANHGDTKFIVRPNGVCFLDSDRSSGYTITDSTGEVASNPTIAEINTQINKVNVYGAPDPDTGILFYGYAENTTTQADGTEIHEYTIYDNSLLSTTDCTNRATNILNGTGFNPTRVSVVLAGVYALVGETVSFAYSPKGLSATTMYVESADHNLIRNNATYILNTGIFEVWNMTREQWALATEGERQSTSGIYTTDINTVNLAIWSPTGTLAAPGWLLVQDDYIFSTIYISASVDTTRDITFTLVWYEANDQTIDGEISLWKDLCNGLAATVTIDDAINHDIAFGAADTFIDTTHTLSAADIDADTLYTLGFQNKDANNIYLTSIQVEYYIKRSI